MPPPLSRSVGTSSFLGLGYNHDFGLLVDRPWSRTIDRPPDRGLTFGCAHMPSTVPNVSFAAFGDRNSTGGKRPIQAILRLSHQRPLSPKPDLPSAETSWKFGHVLPKFKKSDDELTIVSRLPAIVFLSRVGPVDISARLCPARASRALIGGVACLSVHVSHHRAISLARGDDGRLPSEVIAGSVALCGVADFAPGQMPL